MMKASIHEIEDNQYSSLKQVTESESTENDYFNTLILIKLWFNNHHELWNEKEDTSGDSAVKGGIPVINSNKIIPTDHQSAA